MNYIHIDEFLVSYMFFDHQVCDGSEDIPCHIQIVAVELEGKNAYDLIDTLDEFELETLNNIEALVLMQH